MEKVIIIGSGPAGLTAAIYCARAELKPLLIEGISSGGQLMLTTEVENFPGFPNGVMGPDLIEAMHKQAEKFGTQFIQVDVTKVDFSTEFNHKLYTSEKELSAKAVIIATGASSRMLGLESEQKLIGKGVSTCATCDAPFYRNKKVLIIGGGDSAAEEAAFISKFASSVKIVHRRDELRASKIMQQKIFDNPKIDIIWNSVVVNINETAQGIVSGATLQNVKTKEEVVESCNGIFLAIGHIPNTKLFENSLELYENGYLKTVEHTMTSKPGVFAAGDVVDFRYRQAITAAAMGCQAALDVEKYLASAP